MSSPSPLRPPNPEISVLNKSLKSINPFLLATVLSVTAAHHITVSASTTTDTEGQTVVSSMLTLMKYHATVAYKIYSIHIQ